MDFPGRRPARDGQEGYSVTVGEIRGCVRQRKDESGENKHGYAWLVGWTVLAGIGAVLAAGETRADAPEPPPNILLLFADDLGWTDFAVNSLTHQILRVPLCGGYSSPHPAAARHRSIREESANPLAAPLATCGSRSTVPLPRRAAAGRVVLRPWLAAVSSQSFVDELDTSPDRPGE